MTAPAELLHELTVEITPDPHDPSLWRLVATCTCLGFAVTSSASVRAACEAAVPHIDRAHLVHMHRVASGTHHVEDRPEWLP